MQAINVNVGILGHVDSGKTSLVRKLSTCLSTAALDKHPQSKERGITLDLGFSAVALPPRDEQDFNFQLTLVDCPGHASLIRTILGGAQIIDLAILVIDVTKGFQAQTYESLIIAAITTKQLIIVLNKMDLIPEGQTSQAIEKCSQQIQKIVAELEGFENPPIVPISATADSSEDTMSILLDQIRDMLKQKPPQRNVTGPLRFAIDHCFAIKGKGTILTGTVLNGSVQVNDSIEFPALQVTKKVKSMQMFHKSVSKASQGDRVGICVTGLQASLIERGLAAAPGTLKLVWGVVAQVRKAKLFTGQCKSNTKMHITIGHTTALATTHFFGVREFQEQMQQLNNFPQPSANSGLTLGRPLNDFELLSFMPDKDYAYASELTRDPQWVFLKFDHEILCPEKSIVIGSRLDGVPSDSRIAFQGVSVYELSRTKSPTLSMKSPEAIASIQSQMKQLKIYKLKERQGQVEKLIDRQSVAVGRNLFKRESDISQFLGLRIFTSRGEMGTIDSPFGTGGKFRIAFDNANPKVKPGDTITLRFTKRIFDKKSKFRQTGKEYAREWEESLKVRDTHTESMPPPPPTSPQLIRQGLIERLKGETLPDGRNPNAIVVGLFGSDEEVLVDMEKHKDMKVIVQGQSGSKSEVGIIEKPFGKAGKVRVYFRDGTSAERGDPVELHIA